MMLYPAYLWIGPQVELKERAAEFIKETLCSKKGCNACADCTNINKKQHYLVRWLEPDNNYTVAQIEIIFKTIQFALSEGQHFFFVLERADLLNHTCANSLLKSLEEPPQGYHFLLLAPSYENILSTISSRCIISNFDTRKQAVKHTLLPFFTHFSSTRLSDFSKELERSKPTERDVTELVDQIYFHWVNQLKKAINEKSEQETAEKILYVLDNARQHMPMPGSSKLFLRNLFLQGMISVSTVKNKSTSK